MSSLSADTLEARIPGAFPDVAQGTPQISTPQTLAQRLFDRRSEYTRPRTIRIRVGTWNVGGLKDTEKDLAAWFVHSEQDQPLTSATPAGGPSGLEDDTEALVRDGQVGIYALGLQEVVDISSATEALRPYADPTVPNRWKNSMQSALPPGYELISEQQLIGLLLLIYASPATVPHISSVSTTSVGTGLMGYMGNKGAVGARIILGESTRLVFINSHLAAGADKAALERRNWDALQIVSRMRFSPTPDTIGSSQGPNEGIGDEDAAFWFGDLNYRLEGVPAEDVRRLLTIHTRTLGLDAEVETSNPASSDASASSELNEPSSNDSSEEDIEIPPDLDPASLQTMLSSLLPHDELHQQQKAGKAFHDGWKEAPIRFLPSYKYDVGKVGVFDSSDKRRGPSWCDRILYRTKASKDQYEERVREREEARRRDEELKARGVDHAGDEEELLYDYDPAADGEEGAAQEDYDSSGESEAEAIPGSEGHDDGFSVERYDTHLDVVSSDHKPLDAVFLLTFDAVVPSLKATVRQDVAKELDRLENEQRPSVTVVVERSSTTVPQDDFDGADFGDVHYAKPSRRHVAVANTGRVPATLWIMGNVPTWLSVRFDKLADDVRKANNDGPNEQYTLEPGEACSVELQVHVAAMDVVRSLNNGETSLDDVLVLHVAGGRDHFLPMRGRWLPTSFGRSLDELVRVPQGGIRKCQNASALLEGAVMWSVPHEIFRLCETIEHGTERTLAEWAMTGHETERAPWHNNAGWPFVKDPRYFANGAHEETLTLIYEALDCGSSFDSAFEPETTPMQKLELLAEVLLRFLRSLDDGVITEALWKSMDEGLIARTKTERSSDDQKMGVLEVLSSTPHHSASFLLLMSMLDRVASEIHSALVQDQNTPSSSIDLPRSPQVSVRRRTLSKAPEVATRQLIALNYATVFADAIVRFPQMDRAGDREKAARKDRLIDMMQLFLLESSA